jgi:hypothetical protein
VVFYLILHLCLLPANDPFPWFFGLLIHLCKLFTGTQKDRVDRETDQTSANQSGGGAVAQQECAGLRIRLSTVLSCPISQFTKTCWLNQKEPRELVLMRMADQPNGASHVAWLRLMVVSLFRRGPIKE